MTVLGCILDHTALQALGKGSRVSRLVSSKPTAEVRAFVPAMCLVAAVRARPEIAGHVARLPSVECLDLDFDGASMAGVVVGFGADWQIAHAVLAGWPSDEWPDGRPVVTATAGSYAGLAVQTVPVG